MGIEYKTVAVGNVTQVKDEGDGIVSALVSVTGVVDNVKDVIEPGAYNDTLKVRKPKGVWSHDWGKPTSKTLMAEELPPGHPDLPKQMPNGQPWPREAGALRIKTEFNLNTQRGRDAYEDVKFFGPDQEWSIGYKVPEGGATYDKKTGQRHIHKLDLYEYSPVLFGAMPHARTSSVKDAQLAFKQLNGTPADRLAELERQLEELKADFGDLEFKDDASFEGDGDVDFIPADELDDLGGEIDGLTDPELDDGDDVYDDGTKDDKPQGIELKLSLVRKAISTLEELAEAMETGIKSDMDLSEDGGRLFVETKATEYDNLLDAVEDIDVPLEKTDEISLTSAAAAFDYAMESDDEEGVKAAAADVLGVLEKVMDTVDDDDASLKVVARTMADKMMARNGSMNATDDDEEDVEDGGADEDMEDAEKSKGKRRSGYKWQDNYGFEYKNLSVPERTFGYPVSVGGKVELKGKTRTRAFIGGLGNDELLTLSEYLTDVNGNLFMKGAVDSEISDRLMCGVLDHKSAPVPSGQTQHAAFSPKQMAELGAKGQAFKNSAGKWSYPTPNARYLEKAVRAFGRASKADQENLKAYLIKRADKLGCKQYIPDDWSSKSATPGQEKADTETIDMLELKSLEQFATQF